MPNNKSHEQSGSESSKAAKPDCESDGQGQKKDFGDKARGAGASGATGPKSTSEHEETDTAGGREGQFSDEDRDSKEQWSPGSTQPSDQ